MVVTKERENKISLLTYAWLTLVGGMGYYALELLWRGFSHWTMALCGGFCLCMIYTVNKKWSHLNILLRALICSLIITAVEFLTGCTVNLLLGWRVWDYSNRPFNLLGQICLWFSLLWFGLSLILCLVISSVHEKD